jgi:hypothetical protein
LISDNYLKNLGYYFCPDLVWSLLCSRAAQFSKGDRPMKGKKSPSATAVQLEQARDLMNQGESREALIKALSALLQALHTLRGSLLSLQNGLSEMQEIFPLTPAPVKVASMPRLVMKKPPILH